MSLSDLLQLLPALDRFIERVESIPVRKSLIDDPRRVEIWKARVRRVAPLEARYRITVIRYLQLQKQTIVRRLEDYPGLADRVNKGPVEDLMRWLFRFDDDQKLVNVTSQPFTTALALGKKQLLAEISLDAGDISIDNPNIVDYYRRHIPKLVQVNQTTKKKVADVVRQSLSTGDSASMISEKLSDLFEFSPARALRIARTEMGIAYEGGREIAMQEEGIKEHEWLSSRDKNVRDSHLIDGERVNVGEHFSNGLLHPLDPAGDVSETINCRCSTLPL